MNQPSEPLDSSKLNRRKFLKCSVILAASSTFPHLIHANTVQSSERTLEFINLHTDETLHSCYWANGEYDTNSLSEINHILRDHRANEVCEMDPSLIDLLHALHETTGSNAPFHIISAYRSPQTNEKLRQETNGVAKRSLHMQGKAVDIRLPDVELSRLRDAAISLEAGGVGYYAKSNFIHIDIGKARSW
ncbi:MAG: DUF882 domain-containing protein [Gammaproteobacteria bacterium]|nr:MAG: DUF882 domain-containing protein [Gammaproteobacteria bacterium]